MRLPKFLQIAALILLAAGAQPAYSAFWEWSKTAANNSGADPSINWAEGMSPSSVNDSARAMMARAAEYRDDISGLLTTAGTLTAYTVTTNQGLDATPSDGQLLAITVHATNGASPTLQADGGTAFAIQFVPGSAIPSGTLVLGAPYTLKFSTANSAWIVRDFYGNPFNVALGSILWSTVSTAPNSSFVPPYGQCISTTTYSAYWVAMGSPASGACPGGQFAVVDMRGRAPVALDTLPGSAAANRLTSSSTGCGTAMTSVGVTCANGLEGHTLTTTQVPNLNLSASGNASNFQVDGSAVNFQYISAGAAGASGFGSGLLSQKNGTQASAGVSVTGATTNGGGGAFPKVQPVIGLIPYLRIL